MSELYGGGGGLVNSLSELGGRGEGRSHCPNFFENFFLIKILKAKYIFTIIYLIIILEMKNITMKLNNIYNLFILLMNILDMINLT